QEMAVESKAIWKSNGINRKTPNQGENLEVAIDGAKKLYLVVKDGGDNIDWDHANWINPMLYNDKDSLALTTFNWNRASAGWGTVQKNASVSGGKLTVLGKQFMSGIGTHANSVIEYTLPPGYAKFSCTVAIDDAAALQNAGATLQFLVFTENPAGPMVPIQNTIKVSLKDIGFAGKVKVKDVWTGKDLGVYENELAMILPQHGSGLYRITAIKK
ncbi:MAG: hypothetical protein RLY16_391, partial [Bacteroidota bacterium]